MLLDKLMTTKEREIAELLMGKGHSELDALIAELKKEGMI